MQTKKIFSLKLKSKRHSYATLANLEEYFSRKLSDKAYYKRRVAIALIVVPLLVLFAIDGVYKILNGQMLSGVIGLICWGAGAAITGRNALNNYRELKKNG